MLSGGYFSFMFLVYGENKTGSTRDFGNSKIRSGSDGVMKFETRIMLKLPGVLGVTSIPIGRFYIVHESWSLPK